MTDAKLKPAILIVSDTASLDPTSDRAGPVLTEAFAEASITWACPLIKIVPDVVKDIQEAICAWTDNEEFCNLIITTGGTGFAVNDYTPEVRIVLSTALSFPVIFLYRIILTVSFFGLSTLQYILSNHLQLVTGSVVSP